MNQDETSEILGALIIVFGFLLICLLPLVPIVVGGLIGGYRERRHFEELERREHEFSGLILSDLKTPPPGMVVGQSTLVEGSVVIATDRFKSFAAKFRKFFGGEFKGLQRMQERARREAILRMSEKAQAMGATAVCNVRLQTSSLAGKRPEAIAGSEVIVYGTALIPLVHELTPPSLPQDRDRELI